MELGSKRRQGEVYSVREKKMIFNVFSYFLKNLNVSKAIEESSKALGCGKGIIYSIRKEKENGFFAVHFVKRQKKSNDQKNCRLQKYDENTQMLVRRKVHDFFLKNIPPTINMILNSVNDVNDLPTFSRSTLYRFLVDIGFSYEKIGKKVMLMDRDDIIRWRHNYLRQIKKFRSEGRNIVYTDESWVNTGHFCTKAWADSTVSTSRQAFVEGLSTGLQAPKSRGERYALIHAGNENGFVVNAERSFQCKKNTLDPHEEVCADLYEDWFLGQLLPNLPENSVVVMDNAPYHSRKLEKIPTTNWKKSEILQWLVSKSVTVENSFLKRELLELVAQIKYKYDAYFLDDAATKKGYKILRLPPYHCTLNPIEMVWTQVKNNIKMHNNSFKIKDLPNLIKTV